MEMSRIEISLTRLEARIRAMTEGDASTGGIPRKLHNQLLHALVRAMQEEVSKNQSEDDQRGFPLTAPDQYTIVMPAEQAHFLLNHPTELGSLAHKLESSAAQKNLHLAASPILRVVADPTAQELHILVEYSHIEMGDSHTTKIDEMPLLSSVTTDGMMPNAFLIVNGLSTYPLTQPVVNIGSDPINQLVLEDLSVSRMHAQLRFINDRFFIFDLGSKSGTFVNGVAVTSRELNPGDVIILADVPLVYGQEAIPQLGYTQELPAKSPTPEVL
jgi:hypothetical protein